MTTTPDPDSTCDVDDTSGVDSGASTRGLSDLARATLAFEAQWWKYPAAKDNAIWAQFNESPTRYYQRLLVLIEDPVAEAEFPTLVRRLRRVRDQRRAARSARRIA